MALMKSNNENNKPAKAAWQQKAAAGMDGMDSGMATRGNEGGIIIKHGDISEISAENSVMAWAWQPGDISAMASAEERRGWHRKKNNGKQ